MANRALHIADSQAATLPAILQRYRPEIDAALRQRLSGDRLGIYDMLRYSMGWSDEDGVPTSAREGKALRPTLCLFACEATDGSARRAMPAAVSLELIHNFSLIHDDIQDRDETRHHRPTVWSLWGDAKALVAGDALNVIADASLWRLLDEGVSFEDANRAAGLLTEAYLEMIEGQYLDLRYEGHGDVGMAKYLDMISRKTAALIRCALDVGALLGERDAATVMAMREGGHYLGLAFQIRDDMLGIWGDRDATGKPVGADVRRKKSTLPIVYAMSRARGTDGDTLAAIYRGETVDDAAVTSVLEIMARLKTKEYAASLTAKYCDEALSSLHRVELSPRDRRDFEELCHYLSVRQR